MFRKGDRVEYDDAGRTRFGTITKGGKNVTVILDGGEYRVTGPATAFKPSAEPLPQDPPHQMDDWDVVGYKEFRQMSQEPTAFDAVITFTGERVLNDRNRGTGVSKIYHRTEGAETPLNDHLGADAKKWGLAHCLSDTGHFQPGEPWLN